MTIKQEVSDYFDWLCESVCGDRFSNETSFIKLLVKLHSIEFTYILPMDSNRVADGINLRYRYALFKNYDRTPRCLDYDYCSVLEMMIALAIRCEENIMDEPNIGNRVGQWFWGMVASLGLGSMTDRNFNDDYVNNVINTFLSRGYEPNGKGGLFTIKNCKYDLREIEIWYQLCWYLDNMI